MFAAPEWSWCQETLARGMLLLSSFSWRIKQMCPIPLMRPAISGSNGTYIFDDVNTFGPLGASSHFFQKKWLIHKKLDAREGVSAAWPPTSWQNVQDIRRRLDVGSPEDMETARVFFVVGVLVVIFGHLWSECRNIDFQDLYETLTLGEHSCA